MNILDLQILVSQNDVIGVAKLMVWLSLIAFFLVHFENAPRRYVRLRRWLDDRWWRPHEKSIDSMHAEEEFIHQRNDPEFMFESERPLEWDEELYRERDERSRRRKKLLSWYKPVARSKRFFTQFVWPLLVAFIALLCPTLAKILV